MARTIVYIDGFIRFVRDRRADYIRGMRRKAKPRGQYLAAIEEFAETGECSPVELVAGLPSVKDIAGRFGKTPGEVAKDINRVYLESYKPVRGKMLDLLD